MNEIYLECFKCKNSYIYTAFVDIEYDDTLFRHLGSCSTCFISDTFIMTELGRKKISKRIFKKKYNALMTSHHKIIRHILNTITCFNAMMVTDQKDLKSDEFLTVEKNKYIDDSRKEDIYKIFYESDRKNEIINKTKLFLLNDYIPSVLDLFSELIIKFESYE